MSTAVVTGASGPVGRAVALELARAGSDLVVHGRPASRDRLDALRRDVAALGREARPVTADFADERDQDTFAEAVLDLAPAIDALVHCAARYREAPLAALTRAHLAAMLRVNLEAPLHITRLLLPALRRAADPCVVHLTDAAADRPYGRHAAYFASKGGLTTLTRALAAELAPHVRVNAVAPGAVSFPERFSTPKREAITRAIPLRRTGTPQDVARAVRYLVHDAPFVTGQVLRVDGGRSALF